MPGKALKHYLIPIPMVAQMMLMLFMAAAGRPASPGETPDWILHILAYAVLTLFVWLTLNAFFARWRRYLNASVAIITAVFAGIDETIQYFSPSRASQLSDLLMDLVGISLTMIIICCIRKITKETSS